ncbi:MAG: hypothetical protein HFF57_08280 [Lawsonibacter sp.]|jgi:hypothetical protein|nr:hypothetical protein [Lawsonibacter sp.]
MVYYTILLEKAQASPGKKTLEKKAKKGLQTAAARTIIDRMRGIPASKNMFHME